MGWTENTGTKLYLRGAIHSLPVLASAGYDTDLKSYFCYWQGDAKDIPETLKQAVLPGLDELVTLSELVRFIFCAILYLQLLKPFLTGISNC